MVVVLIVVIRKLVGGIIGIMIGAGLYEAVYPTLKGRILNVGDFGDKTLINVLQINTDTSTRLRDLVRFCCALCIVFTAQIGSVGEGGLAGKGAVSLVDRSTVWTGNLGKLVLAWARPDGLFGAEQRTVAGAKTITPQGGDWKLVHSLTQRPQARRC